MDRLKVERKNDKRFTASSDRKSYISNSYPERSHLIDTEFFTASSNVQAQIQGKSNALYVKSITFTAITINAGTYGYHEANAAWSGYTPIGIVGVLLNEAAEISLHDFRTSGNKAVLGYRNDGTTNLTLKNLIANVLYVKN